MPHQRQFHWVKFRITRPQNNRPQNHCNGKALGKGPQLISGTLAFFLSLASGQAVTLDQVYQATLKRSESLEAQKILIEQAENNVTRARDKMAPQLDIGANYYAQGRDDRSSAQTSALARLGIRQPLYRGGTLTSGLDLAKVDREKALTSEQLMRWQLGWAIAQTYFSVLKNEASLRNWQEQDRALEKRQTEVQRRASLGRSRAADLHSTTSQRQTAQAQIQAVKVQIRLGRLQLQQWSGLVGLGELVVPEGQARAISSNGKEVKGEEIPPADSLVNRPDVKLKSLNVVRASSEVNAVEGNLFPELDLVGNYYPARSESYSAPSTLKWEAGVQLKWILDFEELHLSQRTDRLLNRELEKIRERETLRQSREELERRQEALRGLDLQTTQLKGAVTSAEKAWRNLQSDFRAGSVGLIEVVTAENSYWELKRQLDSLILDHNMAEFELAWLNGQWPGEQR